MADSVFLPPEPGGVAAGVDPHAYDATETDVDPLDPLGEAEQNADILDDIFDEQKKRDS